MKPKQPPGERRRSRSRLTRAGTPGAGAHRSRRLFAWLAFAICVGAGLAIYFLRTDTGRSTSPGKANSASVAPPSPKTGVVEPPADSGNAITLEPPPPIIDTNDPVQLLNHGTQLLEVGRIEDAIIEYQRAAALRPEDEEAQFNLGLAHTRLAKLAASAGRSDEATRLVADALRHYNEALRLFPDYPEAHKNLGNLLVELRRYDEAMAHFSAAIRINPDNSSTINSLGKCLGLQGKTLEAMAQFREAVRLNTNSIEARFNLASACAKLGQWDEAIVEFEQVLKLAPDLELAARQLAEVKAKKAAAGK